MKFSAPFLLLIFLLSSSANVLAQKDFHQRQYRAHKPDTIIPISPYPERGLYRKTAHSNYGFGNTEKTIGLAPRVGYDGTWFLGLGIQKGNFWVSHYGGVSQIWGAGFDYSPFDQSMRVHAGAFTHVFSFIGGAQIGGSLFAYQNRELPWQLGFRPEVGLGIYKGFINYGRNIYFEGTEMYRPKNTITLSFYIATYPFS
jgi:hypothetical protein